MEETLRDGPEAFGRPGIEPRWTHSTKEGVGTAYSTSSRLWFTLSHGIINEVYYPTIDHPQVRDLGLLITDGETFCHEEKRHLRHSIDVFGEDTLGWQVTSEDPDGRYRLEKQVIGDPHEPALLMRVRLIADDRWRGRLKVYVLCSPQMGLSGYRNCAARYDAGGREILIAWQDSTHLALAASAEFARASVGYVGASDGWTDLMGNYRMDWQFHSAADGNVALMGEVALPEDGEFVLAMAFGESLHAAATTVRQVLTVPWNASCERFREQWQRVCCGIEELDPASTDGGRLYRVSHKLLLAHEDKTYAGALIASASIPWGEVRSGEDLGGYHLVWTRDMVNSATALLATGDSTTARRALVYLACSQRPDGGFPQNFWLDGTPHWGAVQLDEVAFPIMLAWRLWQADALSGFDPCPLVRRAAAFLIRHGPATDQERWEEASGYSPSTLAATVAALICAADFAEANDEAESARFLCEYADFVEGHIERWTVTTEGELVADIPRHYIRITPTKVGDPRPSEDPNAGMLTVANRPPGSQFSFPARNVVDAGFLELVRYGVRNPQDALIRDSLEVVDQVLRVETPLGPAWRRYNHDGYGQRPDGGPYEGWGQGRAWPLLTGERGHYELAAGNDPHPLITAIERFASAGGMLPEQVWDEDDIPERGMHRGRPAGSAMPLCWAHAEYISLLRSTRDGALFPRIEPVAERYLTGRGRRDLEVWKRTRQVRQVQRGDTLRVQAPGRFDLVWTDDEWRNPRVTVASETMLGISYADIRIAEDQRAPIRFTFRWTDEERWEGVNYEVAVG
ncbi:MAG: glycoside hydrolase family 15 protein [Armatimonadota bacterium]|jgi:glucoamylase